MRRRRAQRRRRLVSAWTLAAGLLVCVVLAFLLSPTGQISGLTLVQVNGVTFALPAGSNASSVAGFSALLARPGATLNLTGDVMQLGAGGPPLRQLDGAPLAEGRELTEGDRLTVRQGGHVLEALRRVSQAIAPETVIAGKGAIVSLVQAGSPGERELFKGVSSGKQAAVFVVRTPQDARLQRSNSAEPGQRLVALTFDDGPGAHTQGVLDALAAKHVPATFFVLGSCAAGNKTMVEHIRAAGHEIESHSWSHPDLTKLSEEQFRSQVARTRAVIGTTNYLRPPYGSSNDTVKKYAAALGLRLVFWSVDTLDWQHQDVDWILSRVKAGTKPGAIILMHDGGGDRSQTIAAIPLVVDWLFANGYSITTVEHILG